MPKIKLENVTLKYKDTVALNNVNIDIDDNKIVGLLGRNGAGKTSMLSLIASLRKPTSGSVTIDGSDPFEDRELMDQCMMVWANEKIQDSGRISSVLNFCNDFRSSFDMDYAKKLLDMFGLKVSMKINSLSQGMRATFNVICAMASRCPITIFDEAYLGMDAPNRKLFYTELLNDYMENPRTIILSTHYILEVESLFEEIIILDKGSVIKQSSAEAIKGKAATLVGNTEVIEQIQPKYNVINTQALGNTKSIVIYGILSDNELDSLKSMGIEIEKPTLQDIFIYLTEKGGSKNVEQ